MCNSAYRHTVDALNTTLSGSNIAIDCVVAVATYITSALHRRLSIEH